MYVKLFEDTLQSSIWAQDSDTRIVWLTLLMMSDENGFVRSAATGIAHFARVPIVTTNKALELFKLPDSDSRTPDKKGRRIEQISGGYQIINYQHYRDIRTYDDRKEYMRKYMRKRRSAESKNVTPCKQTLAKLAHTDTYTDILNIQANLLEQIMDLYKAVKPPRLDPTRGRAKNHLINLFKKHKPEKLLRAVQNYQKQCEAQGTGIQYRRGAGNFFGRDADWEEFARDDWTLDEASKRVIYHT